MRVRILPLPSGEFALIVDRVQDDAMPALTESFRESFGARALLASTDDIELDNSGVAVSEDELRAMVERAGHPLLHVGV